MAEELTRMEKLLGAILVALMGEIPQREKARALRMAGVSNAEIAALLGTTAQVVGQQLYELGATKKKKRKLGGSKARK